VWLAQRCHAVPRLGVYHMLARVATPEDRATLAERIGVRLSPGARGIAVADTRGVRGGCLYDGWLPNSVQCHVLADTPIVWRRLLPHIFLYPFEQVGLGLLVGLIRASNARSLAMAQRVGFREGYRIRDGAALGEDLVLVELRREWCEYLQPRKEAA
jgi:hypothetical protein